MKENEEIISRIESFEEAARDPQIKARLEQDADFRKDFEAQRTVAQLMSLKRYERQSPESAVRIRAGVLRTIRSEAALPATLSSGWWSPWKLAAACGALVLIALPFALQPGTDIQPVTAFTVTESDSQLAGDVEVFQVPENEMLLASNTTPSLQFRPVEAIPVQFTVP